MKTPLNVLQKQLIRVVQIIASFRNRCSYLKRIQILYQLQVLKDLISLKLFNMHTDSVASN